MKDSVTRSHTTLDSHQWPGAVLPPDAKDICHRVPALWKSPACSQPTKHSARWLPRAGCCWQSKRSSSIPNILFSKQLLHTKQREDWVSEKLCPGNLQEDNANSQSYTVLPASHMLWECLCFPKRKARQDKSSQANPGTETSVSLLDLFQSMCFWKSSS